ncbi:MAG: Na+/H+ antiporter NhaA [Acidimicrobiales bacterium]
MSWTWDTMKSKSPSTTTRRSSPPPADVTQETNGGGARPPLPRPLAQTRALREFLATERVGGIVLLAATAIALAWVNSPWRDAYHQLWSTDLGVELGHWQVTLDLRGWVNEGLMAIFFLVVGLEVKRELLLGELRDRRRATLPVVAAIGGMVLPALLYTALNAGGAGSSGWGIPMATDIAFALGVLAVVAPGIPASGRLFLLALAIVDDIGAIVVIAVFYSDSIDPALLGLGTALIAAVVLCRQLRIRYAPLYALFGVALWLALHAAGVHATIAGVAMGLLAPAEPALAREEAEQQHEELADVFSPRAARTTAKLAHHSVSPLESLEHALHPWTSLGVVPLFALANAGVELSAGSLRDAFSSRVAVGVVVALVVGKLVGITGAAWLACRTGLGELPTDLTWRQVAGLGALGGIGFTVSLFITSLAFNSTDITTDATVGIFAAAVLAIAAGTALLRSNAPSTPPDTDGSPRRESNP